MSGSLQAEPVSARPASWAVRPRVRGWSADEAYRRFLGGLAVLVFAVVLRTVIEVARPTGPSLHTFGWGFLTSTDWDPVADKFGALPYLYGTLVSSALALLLSLPVGLGAAVFLAEIAPAKVGDALAFVT